MTAFNVTGRMILSEPVGGRRRIRLIGLAEDRPADLPNVVMVTAPEPYVQYRAPNDVGDAAVFIANGQHFWQSATSNPDVYGPETYAGPDATPRQTYPIRPASSCNFTWVGGLVTGRHPIDVDVGVYELGNSPEDQPYVNSAALILDGPSDIEPSTNLTVIGVRMIDVWDGIRFAPTYDDHVSPPGEFHHRVERCWLSGVLDDAIEDDHDQSVDVVDCLIEDFFELISARKNDGTDRSQTDTIAIDGCLLKIAPRVYNMPGYKWSGTYFNCPYKHTATSPGMTMRNTIIAITGVPNPEPGKIGQWSSMWGKLTDLGGNKLLYLSGDEMPGPEFIGTPPAGFDQQTEAEAQATWDAARAAWIAAHPGMDQPA